MKQIVVIVFCIIFISLILPAKRLQNYIKFIFSIIIVFMVIWAIKINFDKLIKLDEYKDYLTEDYLISLNRYEEKYLKNIIKQKIETSYNKQCLIVTFKDFDDDNVYDLVQIKLSEVTEEEKVKIINDVKGLVGCEVEIYV